MSNTEHCMSPKNRQLWDIIICYVQHRTLHVPKEQTVNVHDYYAHKELSCPQRKDRYGARQRKDSYGAYVFMSDKEQCMSPKKRQLWGMSVMSHKEQCMSPKKTQLLCMIAMPYKELSCPQRKDNYGTCLLCPTKNSACPQRKHCA